MSGDTGAQGGRPGRMRAFAGNSFDDYFDRDMREFPWTARAFMCVAVWLCWAFTRLMWPWRVERAELLASDRRGRVIIQNHESMLEPVIMVVVMWRAGIPLRIVYKSEFDRCVVATWLFSRVGGFPVDRGTADVRAVRRARAALARGECLLIYPEGTRVKSDSAAVVHGGYALMAQLAKAPVQPTAVVGARHLRPRAHVTVRAGEPIEWSGLTASRRKERAQEMERVGMERVYALRDELRAAHPGAEV